MGELELTATQIRAAEILLRKCLPDLQQTDLNVLSTRRYVVEVPQAFVGHAGAGLL
jgi:hypothetical protein